MTISEKVAYIQGLYDGMGLDKSQSGEAKILAEMLDVLKEVGDQLENVDATLDEFGEEIDALSDDLADVEDVIFDDEDDEDDDESEEDFDDFDDEDFFETACPNCGEQLVIDDNVLEAGSIDCPACGQKFALSFDEDCGCGDCEE
jgi:ribosomal protein S27E